MTAPQIDAATDPARINDPDPIPETEQVQAEIADTAATITSTQHDVDQLHERIRDGEPVDHDAVPTRLRIRDHAMQVLTGLIERRARIHAEARLTRLHALRAEIEATDWLQPDADEPLLGLVETATTALTELHQAVNERNAQLHRWSARIAAEDVPPYNGHHPEPPPAHAGLSPSGGERSGIAVGDLTIPAWVSGASLLRTVATRAESLAEHGSYSGVPPHLPRPGRRQPIGDNIRIFQEAPGNSPELPVHMYRADRMPHPGTLAHLVEIDRDTLMRWAHRVDDRHQQAAADAREQEADQ